MSTLIIILGLVWLVYGHLYGNKSYAQARAKMNMHRLEVTLARRPEPSKHADGIIAMIAYVIMVLFTPVMLAFCTIIAPFVKHPGHILYNVYIYPFTGRLYAD